MTANEVLAATKGWRLPVTATQAYADFGIDLASLGPQPSAKLSSPLNSSTDRNQSIAVTTTTWQRVG